MIKYNCNNCSAKNKSSWIKAMFKAGFELRHLDCKECGQQALIATEPCDHNNYYCNKKEENDTINCNKRVQCA